MAEDVEELVVRATPEGIDETTAGLDRMSGKFDETANEMGETTDLLGDLERRFSGAFGAIIAGLTVATAGLLTQVPIIGEVFGGLGSVVNSIAYQIDRALRPALTGVVEGLYELSGAIAEGDLDKIKEIFSGFFSAVAGFDYGQLIKDVASAIAGVITEVDWLGIGADIIKAIGGALAHAVFGIDWFGWVSDFVTAIGNEIASTDWIGIAEDILSGILGALEDIAEFSLDLAGTGLETLKGVLDTIKGFAESAFGALKDIAGWTFEVAGSGLDMLLGVLKSARDFVTSVIEDLQEIAETTYETVVDVAMDLPGSDLATPSPGFDPLKTARRFRNDSAGGTETTTTSSIDFQTGGGIDVNLDGQTLNDQQSQYNDNYTRNGGR